MTARRASTWDPRSDALRPAGWTSADAAVLPIFQGLVSHDEVRAGAIDHVLRFTVRATQAGDVSPAPHCASSDTNPNEPAMGMRFWLKATLQPRGLHRRGARRAPGLKELRDDGRRQQHELVHHRRGRSSLERQRPRPAEDGCRAPRSTWWTPVRSRPADRPGDHFTRRDRRRSASTLSSVWQCGQYVTSYAS